MSQLLARTALGDRAAFQRLYELTPLCDAYLVLEHGRASVVRALDLAPSGLATREALQARAVEAKQIVDLCALLQAEPETHVRSGKGYAEVRNALAAQRAEASDGATVDTSRSSSSTNPANPVPFNPIALWNEIRAVQQESYK